VQVLCVRNLYSIMVILLLSVSFFFFQAEDGIRNKLVTGVQTCALPIYDRDRNAAANLARWAERHHLEPRTPKHGGRVTNVRRRDGADRHVTRVGETTSEDVGTDVKATPVARTEDAREGRCHTPTRLCDTLQSQVSSVVAVRKASRSSRHCAGVFLSGSMPVYSPR